MTRVDGQRIPTNGAAMAPEGTARGTDDLGVLTRHVATLLVVLRRLDAALSAAVGRPDPAGLPLPAPDTTLLGLDAHPSDSRFRQLAVEFELSELEPQLGQRELDVFTPVAATEPPVAERRARKLLWCRHRSL